MKTRWGDPHFKGIAHRDGSAALGISSRGPESERGWVLGEGLLTSLQAGKRAGLPEGEAPSSVEGHVQGLLRPMGS